MGTQQSKLLEGAEGEIEKDDPEVTRVLSALTRYHINPVLLDIVEGGDVASGGYGFVRRAKHFQTEAPIKPYANYKREKGTGALYIVSDEEKSVFAKLLSSKEKPVLITHTEVVAVKGLRFTNGTDYWRLRRRFAREMMVWAKLDHPNIAKFLGFHVDFEKKVAWFVSPWERYGNVSQYLKKKPRTKTERLQFLEDTAEALTYLHELHPAVCHGDMKASNVLVNQDRRALLCDFGLATTMDEGQNLQTSTGFKGSIRWCSPELFDNASRTTQSDVWGWGATAFEIMSGNLPYGDTTNTSVIMLRILECTTPYGKDEEPFAGSPELHDLLQRCWEKEPKARPTMRECLGVVSELHRNSTPIPYRAPSRIATPTTGRSTTDLTNNTGSDETKATSSSGTNHSYSSSRDSNNLSNASTHLTVPGQAVYTDLLMSSNSEISHESGTEIGIPVGFERETRPSGLEGGNGGTAFSDSGMVHDIRDNYICGILVHYNKKYIIGIRVLYRRGRGKAWGKAHGPVEKTWRSDIEVFQVAAGEIINRVEGRAGTRIDALQFYTNLGRKSQRYGGSGGHPFTWAGDELLFFAGRSSLKSLEGLEAHWDGRDDPDLNRAQTWEKRKSSVDEDDW